MMGAKEKARNRFFNLLKKDFFPKLSYEPNGLEMKVENVQNSDDLRATLRVALLLWF
jgi:hypothetical protein